MGQSRLLLAVLLIGSAFSLSHAADRYYATAGSDANEPCAASGTPCQTIAKMMSDILNLAACGDTYFLNKGDTWTAANLQAHRLLIKDLNCTMGNEFTLTSYGTGARPILDFTALNAAPTVRNGHYVIIDGLHYIGGLHDDFNGVSNLIFRNNEVEGSVNECIHIRRLSKTTDGNNSSNVLIENNIIHDCGSEPIYLGVDPTQLGACGGTPALCEDESTDITIRGNEIYDSGEIEKKPGPRNVIIENNYIHGLFPRFGGAIFISGTAEDPPGGKVETNTIIRGNYITGTTNLHGEGWGIRLRGHGSITRNIVHTSAEAGIRIQDIKGDGHSMTATFNTIYNNTGACTTISGTGASQANNICWANGSGNDADPRFVNAGANDFNLCTGTDVPVVGCVASPAINDASDGTDRGAIEAPQILANSCEIGGVDTTTFVADWFNDAHAPLSSITDGDLTINYNGTPTAHAGGTVIQGTNQTRTTMDSAAVGGQTITLDAAYGAAKGALIGLTLTANSPAVTGVACLNNVGGSLPALSQVGFRFYANENWYMALNGTPTSVTGAPPAEGETDTARAGGCLRGRFKWECDAGSPVTCPPQGYRYRVSKNGGAYADIPETCTSGTSCLMQNHPTVADGAATTEQLTAGATFTAAEFRESQLAIPSIALAQGQATEGEIPWCFATDVVPGDQFCVRVYEDDGDALGTYDAGATGCVTIATPFSRRVGGGKITGGLTIQ